MKARRLTGAISMAVLLLLTLADAPARAVVARRELHRRGQCPMWITGLFDDQMFTNPQGRALLRVAFFTATSAAGTSKCPLTSRRASPRVHSQWFSIDDSWASPRG
jgi:hypothetical protein